MATQEQEILHELQDKMVERAENLVRNLNSRCIINIQAGTLVD